MPIVDVTGSRIQSPLGSAANPNLNCGDLSKLLELRGKGKFDSKKFTKSLLSFAIEQMISGPFSRIINNQTLLPQELSGLGAILGVGALLTDPANAAGNMQNLWSSVASNAVSEFGSIASSMAANGGSFASMLATMPKPAISSGSLEVGLRATQQILAGAAPNTPEMQSRLTQLCYPYGANSPTIFATLDAAKALNKQADTLNLSLDASSKVFGAAPSSLKSSVALAPYGVNKQIADAGASGVRYDLEQLRGLANLPPSFFNPSGPDALRSADILRQSCTTVENFYSTFGFGTAVWEETTGNFTDAILTSDIPVLAATVAGFAGFDPDAIIVNTQNQVDSFLSRAFSDGGSTNLANGFSAGFGEALNAGTTALQTVSSLYGSSASMTQTFTNALAIMELAGSASSIQAILGGNIDALFGLASGQITNPYLTALRALRDCMKDAGADAQSLAIIEGEIKKAEALENNRWVLMLNKFDANGFFNAAQKIQDALAKVQDNLVKGTPIRSGETTAVG